MSIWYQTPEAALVYTDRHRVCSAHTASGCVVSLLQDIFRIKKKPSGKNCLEGNLVIGRKIRRLGKVRVWGRA